MSHERIIDCLQNRVFPRTGPARSQLIKHFQLAMQRVRFDWKIMHNTAEVGFTLGTGRGKDVGWLLSPPYS